MKEFGLAYFGMDDKRQGIVHIIGPENGFTLPGTTVVCGDRSLVPPFFVSDSGCLVVSNIFNYFFTSYDFLAVKFEEKHVITRFSIPMIPAD